MGGLARFGRRCSGSHRRYGVSGSGWMGGWVDGWKETGTRAAATAAAAAVGISVYPAWPARRLTVSLPLLFLPERCGVAAAVHLLSWRSADMTERLSLIHI